MNRDEAVALIERMKKARPVCPVCDVIPFYSSSEKPDCPPGYELGGNFYSWVKRCAECSNARSFPWADDLTPEAVVAFIEREPWRDDIAWPLDELKPVADDCKPRGGFEFL